MVLIGSCSLQGAAAASTTLFGLLNSQRLKATGNVTSRAAAAGRIAKLHRPTSEVAVADMLQHILAISCRDRGSPNRWEPVRLDRLPVKPVRPGSGLGRYETGPNSKFKFELKKMKNS